MQGQEGKARFYSQCASRKLKTPQDSYRFYCLQGTSGGCLRGKLAAGDKGDRGAAMVGAELEPVTGPSTEMEEDNEECQEQPGKRPDLKAGHWGLD